MKAKMLIKDIVFLQEIYPRFEIDFQRVEYFAELMKTGTQFPPLCVVKENDLCVLLDGKHRLEAKKQIGETDVEVKVCNTPKKYWRLAAARFNLQSSKPLSGDELKMVIIEAWKSGIRHSSEIAEQIGYACTARYVRKIIKPLRDRNRQERERQIRDLESQGLSQRQIAELLGISPGTVNNILNRSKMELVPFLNTGGSLMSSSCVKEQTSSRSYPVDPQNKTLCCLDHKRKENNSKTEFLSCLPDIEALRGEKFASEETHTIQTLELVKRCNKSIADISKEVGKSTDWIKRTMIAAISISLNSKAEQESMTNKIAQALHLNIERILILRELLLLQGMLSPIGDHLPEWVKHNLDHEDIKLLAEIASVSSSELAYILRGQSPPQISPRAYMEVPQTIINQLRETCKFFRELSRKIRMGMFKDKSFSRFLKEYNKVRAAVNEVDDELIRYKKAYF
ncbi:MAG: hypothetical protein DRG59_03685 [Deltaproteobacteria bacterium]|nr:MAG: hypothetical protein DRG59_03685 [Deltaproteobacteria bacterium]